MIDINTSSDFPPSFLAAREKANAAGDAERAAWEAMQTQSTGGGAAQAWRKAQEEARQAQDEFEREVRDWFANNALD
jgi:hypothetical protein